MPIVVRTTPPSFPGYYLGHLPNTDEAIEFVAALSLQLKKVTAKSNSRFLQTLALGAY